MNVLSAGKNEIIHICFNNKSHWLINVGRGKPSDQGRWIITPYLRSQGINQLTGIVLMDGKQKNIGGLNTVLRNFSTDYLFYNKQAVDLEVMALYGKYLNKKDITRQQEIAIEGGGTYAVIS